MKRLVCWIRGHRYTWMGHWGLFDYYLCLRCDKKHTG